MFIIDNGLVGQAGSFLRLEVLLLKYSKNENIDAVLNLVLKTNFANEVLVNLNYLKGLNGDSKLGDNEVKIINACNDDFCRNYFIKLLATGIVNINELFQLIVIHAQRNFFNPLQQDQLERLRADLVVLEQEKEFPITNPELIKHLAIFGATYKTQKDRLEYGLKEANSKGINYDNVYLLTGFRRIYISELEQLNILSSEALKVIKEEYKKQNNRDINNVNIQELVDFLSKPKNERFLRLWNLNKLRNVLKDIARANAKYRTQLESPTEEEKKHMDELSITDKEIELKTPLELLELLSNMQELDLFKLGVYELEVPAEKVNVAYSRELSGSNIMHGQQVQGTVKRANTLDTLKTMYELNPDFQNILFVSNGALVKQQLFSVLDAVSEKNMGYLKGKTYLQTIGSPAKYSGDAVIKTKAAQLFGLTPTVSRLFEKRLTDVSLIGNNALKELKGKTPDEAYKVGQSKQSVSLGR